MKRQRQISHATSRAPLTWRMPWSRTKVAIGGLVGLVGLIATVIGVTQFIEERQIPDLSGEWMLTVTIDETSYQPYRGMTA